MAPGSQIPTCKFYNELIFLKDVVTNRVTTTNLAIPESDINVTTPPGSQTFTLQQQMSPCHPVVSQSSEELLQLTTHNHELKSVTPKEDKKGKRRTSATDEVNEFDKACLDLLQKKSNTDADTHFCLKALRQPSQIFWPKILTPHFFFYSNLYLNFLRSCCGNTFKIVCILSEKIGK